MCRQNELRQARELVRLHTQLSDEVARYKNEIQALLVVLFPEFSQIFDSPVPVHRCSSAQTLSQCPSDRSCWS
jgi:hypothetical protein